MVAGDCCPSIRDRPARRLLTSRTRRNARLLQIIFFSQTEERRLSVALHRQELQVLVSPAGEEEGSPVEGDDARIAS